MTRRLRAAHPLFIAALLLALTLPPAAMAVRDPGGGSPASGCAQNAPRVSVGNTFAWASPGSWGFPGQQLTYSVGVSNADSGCSSSSFVLKVSAPSGFLVSTPTSTITVNSGSTGYLRVYVTSPATAADGDYPLTVTVERAGTPSPAATSYYKVYSSDTVAPKLYWTNPSDGAVLSGRTTYVGFASSDDHAVKTLEVFLDNVLVAAKDCDNVAYECQLSYKWSLRRARGQHTATFRSTDWMGNVGTYNAAFTVS
jgi:NPCBM-associated, NEW3 domain of alpha-galactosidase